MFTKLHTTRLTSGNLINYFTVYDSREKCKYHEIYKYTISNRKFVKEVKRNVADI